MFNLKQKSAALMAVLLVAGLLGTSGPVQGQARSLQAVDYVTIEGDRLLITLTLSATAPEPTIFTIDNPARLSLDFPDTALSMTERFKKVNVGKVRAVAVAEAKGRTRVVVELTDLTPYTVRVDGNKVFVQLDGGPASSIAAAPTVSGRPAPEITGSRMASVSGIDFRRGEKGEGRVVVTLTDAKIPVDVNERGGQIVARFKNAELPDSLLRRLDVLDFATPVKYVDIRRDGVNAEIILTPVEKGDFEQVAYQAGNVFSLELHPMSQEDVERRKKENPQFVGERVTLSFQSVDVRSLLQIIADVAGTNMVVSDSVSGDIAMRLQNVPWDQALDIILRTKGLGMRQQGNVMLVAPLAELAEREKVEMEAEKQKTELAPLRSEMMRVNYAKASDIAKLLKTNNNSLLSERGGISVDDRTNTMIVLETREKLAEIRELLAQLDVPVRQVLIESRVVVARDDYVKELGTRFGVSTLSGNGANGISTSSGSLEQTTGFITDISQGNDIELLPSRLNVNLPTTGEGGGAIAFAILGANYLVDLELSALQSEGRGEVVSTPRVVTANGKEAVIEQGREIPFREASSSGATATSFKKAVLSLLVTPQITPDQRVLMDLVITNDQLGQELVIDGVRTLPIDIRRLRTQALVRSGDTLVLGGVFERSTDKSAIKIPLLGDIPLLGKLFRNDSNRDNKRELLVFITPKILQDGLRVN